MIKPLAISILVSSSLLAFDFNSALKGASEMLNQKEEKSEKKEYVVPNYNQKTSLMLAYIADGVFWDDFGKRAFINQGFNYGGYIEAKEGVVDLQFAYGSKGTLNSKMDIVVSIRGSKENMDWVTDINFIPKPYNEKIDKKITVHSGFLQSAKLLESKEKDAKIQNKSLKVLIELNAQGKRADRFFITGHSLGGAVATVYSTMLIDRGIKKENLIAYTYGAPPISMDEGTQKENMSSTSFDGKLGAISNAVTSSVMGDKEKGVNHYIDYYSDKIELFRIYDSNDVVPKLIPPTRHLGTAVMYGDKLSKEDLLNTSKIWKIHWMNNYVDKIKNTKPQDPTTKSGGLIDLVK